MSAAQSLSPTGSATPLLSIQSLCVDYSPRSRWRKRTVEPALNDVSLDVERGGSLGVVGESGCGKSTLARTIVGLQAPTSGRVLLDGVPLGASRDRQTRRRVQMVFQDPSSSLNPRRTVGATLSELLSVHGLAHDDPQARCRELLELVELPSSALQVYPAGLSGGQRQRVGIARALAVNPDILIADEAVSALDVSVQASIMVLLARLRAELGLTMLFISHDLAVVRHVTERTIVMSWGRIVEDRPTTDLFADPQHEYTQKLLAAAPRLEVATSPRGEASTDERITP